MEHTINLTADGMAAALEFAKTHKRLGNVMDCLLGLCTIDNELFIAKFYDHSKKDRLCVVESLGATDEELDEPIGFRQEEFLKFLEMAVKNKNTSLEINIDNEKIYFKSGGCQIGLQIYVNIEEKASLKAIEMIRAQADLQKKIIKVGADVVKAINDCVGLKKLDYNKAPAIVMEKGNLITTNTKQLLIENLGGDLSFNACNIKTKITKKDVVGIFDNQLYINNIPVALTNTLSFIKEIEKGADYIKRKTGLQEYKEAMRVSINAGILSGLQTLGKYFIFKIAGNKMIIENTNDGDDNSVSAKLEIPLLENINGEFVLGASAKPFLSFLEICKKEIKANEVLTLSFVEKGVFQFEIGNKYFLMMQAYLNKTPRVWKVYNTEATDNVGASPAEVNTEATDNVEANDNEKAEAVESEVAVDNVENDNQKAEVVESEVANDNTKNDNEKAEVVKKQSDAIASEFNLSKRLSRARRKELKRAFKNGKIKLAY